MPASIQRFAQALLPLLSIKAPDTPRILEESVKATLDMMASFVADRLEVVSADQAAVTAPATLTVTVPSGEYWYVFNVSAGAASITAGSVISMAVGIGDATGANSYIGATPLTAATIATQAVVCAATQGIPVLLKPGMRLIAQLLVDPGAGTADLSLRALIARLANQS